MEVRKLGVVSTGHMTDEDQKTLTKWCAETDWATSSINKNAGIQMLACPHPYGWILWAREETEGEGVIHVGLSEHVAAACRHAVENGCDYLLFDRDGPVVDGLKTFDW